MNEHSHSTPSPAHMHHAPGAGAKPAEALPLTDPVCGMPVTNTSEHRREHNGQVYYFCSTTCQDKFAADPLHYATPAQAVEASPPELAAVAGAIYTCPMHPEVRQDHPGNCPKCGMTLDRKSVV